MSRTFTKIGKEITIAVKSGGPDPTSNSRLRALMANAKAANMPKDTVERAIKKATDKDASDYKEVVFEGYGPFGIAILVETATDNNTRTVANVRSYFNKFGGNLGTSGSLSFLFDHKCVFHIKPKDGVSLEDLELELIDYGVDELDQDEEGVEDEGRIPDRAGQRGREDVRARDDRRDAEGRLHVQREAQGEQQKSRQVDSEPKDRLTAHGFP